MADDPKLIFDTAIEGLFLKALAGRLTPALVVELRRAGVDVEKPLLPAYPFEVWHAALHATVQALWPALPVNEGYRQLGRTLVLGYRETLIGRALEGIARLIGPERMLARMDKNIRGGDNHTRVTFSRVEKGVARLDVTDTTAYPTYFCGIFEAAAELAGAKEVKAEVVTPHPPGALIEVRWR